MLPCPPGWIPSILPLDSGVRGSSMAVHVGEAAAGLSVNPMYCACPLGIPSTTTTFTTTTYSRLLLATAISALLLLFWGSVKAIRNVGSPSEILVQVAPPL